MAQTKVANFSMKLPQDLNDRLNHLAEVTQRSKSFYVAQALREYLEDLEDYYLALERLNDKNASYLTSHEAREYLEI